MEAAYLLEKNVLKIVDRSREDLNKRRVRILATM
ncbi:hypothetical protein P0O15_03280 [Methanotrichaceae archaeon Mx]|uniref:tRNA intron endonuclease N-terminal domain-containing protein n=1 Tax=Candidatus Methanocrinis natronophilus TaxID=3033396 RepID=A0ABT5X685_9EURY|nr:hypothetical protein [Candidatus Methanocrinis natronophilus]MDF0590197.1 hypothetical protein [Candidatus Methanocrinis natronophilus]